MSESTNEAMVRLGAAYMAGPAEPEDDDSWEYWTYPESGSVYIVDADEETP